MTFKQCSNCGCMKNIKEGEDVCIRCAKEIESRLKSLQGICKNEIVENKFTEEELIEKLESGEDMFEKFGIGE